MAEKDSPPSSEIQNVSIKYSLYPKGEMLSSEIRWPKSTLRGSELTCS